MRLPRKMLLSSINAGLLFALFSSTSYAQTVHDAISQGKVYANFNLRYEDVSQSNTRLDASALTLRTRLGYTSSDYKGWSFNVEMEDSRIALGQGDYSVDPAAYNAGVYSVIADPETTELDQAYVKYQSDQFSFTLGRQVIALDGQRFVGHVGWRQDRQTFDAATLAYSPNDKVKASYSYVTQRNRIFAQAQDLDAKDHFFNGSYMSSFGKFVGYAYLLEIDNNTTNALDTFGLSFDGKTAANDLTWLYHFEVASQSAKTQTDEFDTRYVSASVGAVIKGYTTKLSYENLGSDDGQLGFATPLATLHKFNGWADVFLATPAQGLVDIQLSVAGKAFDGKWVLAYHDYKADDATDTVDDLGSEINAQFTTAINKHYKLGLKYANYSGGSMRPDTDKIWAWVSTSF